MSKSRTRTTRDSTPRLPDVGPPRSGMASVRQLTGELKDTFESLVEGLALLARAPDPFDDLSDAELEELAGVHDEIGEDISDAENEVIDATAATLALNNLVGLTTRVLARQLLEQVLGRKPVARAPNDVADSPQADALSQREMLDELSASIRASHSHGDIKLSRAERQDAVDQAGATLEELGLEEFDALCMLVEGRNGTFELETIGVSPETAHSGLIEILFDRAESVVAADPLLAVERLASQWEFSCWSAPPTPGVSLDGGSFTLNVREQEYSLARRPTVALGSSLLGEIATDEVFAESFPRQHRMAQALVQSFVGVFECIALDGHRATFRSVRDGQTFEVYEHMVPAAYRRGYVALGRLIPFEGALHLRSPGMMFSGPPIEPMATETANAFNELCATLPPDLALEAVIARTVFEVRVPREVKPAQSRAVARELLEELVELLIDAPEPDDTLDDFMDALALQAESGSDVAQRQNPARKSKKKSRQKSKRRR